MTMFDYKDRRETIPSSLLWICLIATITVVTFILFDKYKYMFHSDAAIKTVLSQIALSGSGLIPRDWVYANGDLFLIGAYPFSIILYPTLGVSYIANASASVLSYSFLLLSIFGTCRYIAPDRPRSAIAATALAAAGLSAANFEFVIGQGAYSMYIGLALCLCAFAANPPVAADWSKRARVYFLTFIAAGLMCVSNATRGDIIIILPILAGWLASVLMQPPGIRQRRIHYLHCPAIYVVIAGAIAATLLYEYLLFPRVLNFNAAGKITIASLSEMRQHILRLPEAWFEYFRISGSWETLPTSFRTLQSVVWLIAIAILFTPMLVVFTPKRNTRPIVTLCWIVLAAYSVGFGAMIVSANLFSSALDIRYVTFPIYGSVCVVAIVLDACAESLRRLGAVLLLAMGMISVTIAAVLYSMYRPTNVDQSGSDYAQRMALIGSLEANHVGTILATYWNSHVLTVLSNGKVHSYPVSVDVMLHPYPHHMPRRILYGVAGAKQAVVFTNTEVSAQTWEAVEYQLGVANETLKVGPYIAWIYNRDIVQAVIEAGQAVDSPVSKNLLQVRLSAKVLPTCGSSAGCTTMIDVTNLGQHALASVGFLPLRLGVHGIDGEGRIVVQDAGRADFPTVIEPRGTRQVKLTLPESTNPKVAAYQVCLLQEGVSWFCENTMGPRP